MSLLDYVMLPACAVLAATILTAHFVYRRRVLPALATARGQAAAGVEREPAGYWSQVAAYGALCRERGESLAGWRLLRWVPRLSTLVLIALLVVAVLSAQ